MGAVRRGDLRLSRYALVGDGVTATLVADDGAVDWLCHGRFDGPAVFCRLLDEARGGFFQIAPVAPLAASQRYVGNTNVVTTELAGDDGAMRITDCMPLGAGGGPTLLRKVEGLRGELEVHVELFPTFDFARAATAIELLPGGCRARGADRSLWLACPVPMHRVDGGAVATFRLRAGDTRWLILTHGSPPLDEAQADAALRSTIDAWENWSSRGRYPERYGELLRRSALLLKLLIHAPTGAMVAAPTTSLPETLGGVRNWDYRFTWLRDASWVVEALMDLGYHDESMAFIGWLESLGLARDAPAVCYDLDGRRPDDERELSHLCGYRESRPVRIGNAAARQDQHDLFGAVRRLVAVTLAGLRAGAGQRRSRR